MVQFGLVYRLLGLERKFGNEVVCLVWVVLVNILVCFWDFKLGLEVLVFDNYGGDFGLVWFVVKWYVFGTKVVCFIFGVGFMWHFLVGFGF